MSIGSEPIAPLPWRAGHGRRADVVTERAVSKPGRKPRGPEAPVPAVPMVEANIVAITNS